MLSLNTEKKNTNKKKYLEEIYHKSNNYKKLNHWSKEERQLILYLQYEYSKMFKIPEEILIQDQENALAEKEIDSILHSGNVANDKILLDPKNLENYQKKLKEINLNIKNILNKYNINILQAINHDECVKLIGNEIKKFFALNFENIAFVSDRGNENYHFRPRFLHEINPNIQLKDDLFFISTKIMNNKGYNPFIFPDGDYSSGVIIKESIKKYQYNKNSTYVSMPFSLDRIKSNGYCGTQYNSYSISRENIGPIYILNTLIKNNSKNKGLNFVSIPLPTYDKNGNGHAISVCFAVKNGKIDGMIMNNSNGMDNYNGFNQYFYPYLLNMAKHNMLSTELTKHVKEYTDLRHQFEMGNKKIEKDLYRKYLTLNSKIINIDLDIQPYNSGSCLTLANSIANSIAKTVANISKSTNIKRFEQLVDNFYKNKRDNVEILLPSKKFIRNFYYNTPFLKNKNQNLKVGINKKDKKSKFEVDYYTLSHMHQLQKKIANFRFREILT